ncbi:GlxA family transcriptional regulator [Arthrobacter sp. NPDC090010]|uniref:GlxA family transcriptional regulator n=1 Tax=Arthrobacter sp. NPDC090010 TaxID=3363942 RepID=UPI00380B305A
MNVPRVTVLAFEGINPFHLSVPSLVWGSEVPRGDMEPWDLTVVAERPGPVRTSAGYSLAVDRGLDSLPGSDLVVVPWWSDPCAPAPDGVAQALREAHDNGAIVVGLCLGAFVVADSGLLNGHEATTHWKWAETFRRRFPSVHLRPEKLYVDEGRLVTGAGATAGIDTCLHLLARLKGQALANQVARRIVAAPHRSGGQAQFIEAPMPSPGPDPLTGAMTWALDHLDERLSIDALAERAHLSRSSFTRAFRDRTGSSLHRWLVAQRVSSARHLLESTGLEIETIARKTGFGSSARMREHFARLLGTTPSRYREGFAGHRH